MTEATRTASDTKRPLTIIVTGGGSGGHVYPTLEVVRALRESLALRHVPLEAIYVGRRSSREAAIVSDAGIPYRWVNAGKLRRYVDVQNLVDPIRVVLGFFEAIALLLRFRPKVLFAKGGYVSLPLVYAARMLGIPVVSHETDAVMGLSNRLAARLATTLCTSFPTTVYKQRPGRARLIFTGHPVRPAFFSIARPIDERPTYRVLVTAGSQGAVSINRVIRQLIQRPPPGVAIFHVTGPTHYDEFAPLASANYHPIDYADDLAELMSRADLVISRAGGTIFELAAAARPSVLIPLSTSANRHQEENARYFEQRGAAVVLGEADLTTERLRSLVTQLLGDRERRQTLSDNILALAKPNASRSIASEVARAAGLLPEQSRRGL